LRVDAVEWNRRAAAGRVDLGPVAVELRLGHWHLGGSESADDRHLATDVWTGRTQTHQASDRLTVRKLTRGPGPHESMGTGIAHAAPEIFWSLTRRTQRPSRPSRRPRRREASGRHPHRPLFR